MANTKTFTVKDLMKILKSVPANTPIVMSSDSEGNSYGMLTEMCNGGLNKVTKERYGVEVHSDDDAPENAIDALLLYPD